MNMPLPHVSLNNILTLVVLVSAIITSYVTLAADVRENKKAITTLETNDKDRQNVYREYRQELREEIKEVKKDVKELKEDLNKKIDAILYEIRKVNR